MCLVAIEIDIVTAHRIEHALRHVVGIWHDDPPPLSDDNEAGLADLVPKTRLRPAAPDIPIALGNQRVRITRPEASRRCHV